jgi:hypothetical protein
MSNLVWAYYPFLPDIHHDRSCTIVMAMSVSMDNTLALTVSADHLVGRYDLVVLFVSTILLWFPDPHVVDTRSRTHRRSLYLTLGGIEQNIRATQLLHCVVTGRYAQ